jgi:hypothetical protein
MPAERRLRSLRLSSEIVLFSRKDAKNAKSLEKAEVHGRLLENAGFTA